MKKLILLTNSVSCNTDDEESYDLTFEDYDVKCFTYEKDEDRPKVIEEAMHNDEVCSDFGQIFFITEEGLESIVNKLKKEL
jgi:hypothetical protein